MIQRYMLRIALLVLLVAVAAVAPMRAQSGIRLVHLSPDAPNVDFYLDDTVNAQTTNLPFGSATGIVQASVALHRVKVAFAGTHPDTARIDADVNLPANRRISILLLDSLKDFTASTINFSLDAIGYTDTTYFRVVNASPNLSVADVRFTDAKGNQTTLSNIIFKGVTLQFLGLPVGKVRIEVFESSTAQKLADVTGTFQGERFETIILSDFKGQLKVRSLSENSPAAQNPLRTLQTTSTSTNGYLRVVNAVTGTPNVDIYLDDQTPARIQNIGYQDASEAIQLAQGTHNVKVTLTGLPIGTAIYNQDYTGSADSVYSSIGIGSLQTQSDFRVLSHPLDLQIPSDSVLVRVLHGSGDNTDLNFQILDASGALHQISPLKWGQVSSYMRLPAGPTTVSFVPVGETSVSHFNGSLAQNTAITLIINGDLHSQDLTVNVLYDNDTTRQAPMEKLNGIVSQPNGSLRVISLVKNKPVDFRLDDDTTMTLPLDYRHASPTTDDYGGSVNVKFADRGAGFGSPLLAADVQMTSEGYTAIYLIENTQIGGLDTMALYADEANIDVPINQIDTSKALVRIVNLRSTTNLRLQGVGGYDKLFSGVGYKQATRYTQVPEGKVTFRGGGNGYSFNVVREGGYTVIFDDDVSLLIDSDENGQFPMLLLSTSASAPIAATGQIAPVITPNPTNGAFAIRCQIESRGEVTATLIDVLGRTVASTTPKSVEPGEQSFVMSSQDVAPGTYTVVVTEEGGHRVASGRVVIVR
jgi:hypothetical protein